MSVCAQPEDESSVDETGFSHDWQEDKAASKVVRVLTVLAYLLSVSLAAILLSVYYVCVWRSPELPLEHAEVNARRAHPAEYDHAYHESPHAYNHSGGSNTTVSDAFQAANNTTSPYEVSSSSEHSPSPHLETTDQPSTTDAIAPSSNEPNYTNVT